MFKKDEKQKNTSELSFELSLKMSERRYRMLVESSPYCIHEIDLDGALISMNPAGLRMMGVSHEDEIRGTPYLNAVCKSDQDYVAELLKAALKGKASEFQFEAANGLFFRSTFVPVPDETGTLEKIMGLTVDITEEVTSTRQLHQLNEKLEQIVEERTFQLQKANAELKKKNQDLEQLSYILSHDLKTPLFNIAGFTEMLMDNQEQLNENDKEAIGCISQSAKHMEELINHILIYSRLGHTLKVEQIDCNELFRDVIDGLFMVIHKAKASLSVDLLPTIKGLRIELRLLIQNLIENAIKFQKPGVPIEIKISAEEGSDGWIFSVADNGIGINPNDKNSIFQIFKRLHRQDKYKGTGVGLAHCKKIVELHNGKIWVDSELGKGSTFFFTIGKISEAQIEKAKDCHELNINSF